MASGRVVVDSVNIIIDLDACLIRTIGDIRSLNGATVCTLADGTRAEPDLGMQMLDTARRMGALTGGHYWITGPRGTVWVRKVSITPVRLADTYIYVCMVEYDAQVVDAACFGGMVLTATQEPPMPTTVQPAALSSHLDHELSVWREAMPGQGFSEEQISLRLRDARRMLGQIGAASMRDLTTQQLAAWMSDRIRAGIRKKTCKTDLSLLVAFGDTLLKAGEIHTSAAAAIKPPKGMDPPSSKRMRAFTQEEMERLFAVAEADEAAPPGQRRYKDYRSVLYIVMSLSGGRRRETSRLRWMDIDLDADVPTLTFLGKNQRVESVPLVPRAVDALRRWRTLCEVAGPEDRVFAKWPDERILVWDMKLAGVPQKDERGRPARWSSFRKGLATNLVESKAEIPFAQRILRHKDPKLTTNVYASIRDSKLLDEMMRIPGAANKHPASVHGRDAKEKKVEKSVRPHEEGGRNPIYCASDSEDWSCTQPNTTIGTAARVHGAPWSLSRFLVHGPVPCPSPVPTSASGEQVVPKKTPAGNDPSNTVTLDGNLLTHPVRTESGQHPVHGTSPWGPAFLTGCGVFPPPSHGAPKASAPSIDYHRDGDKWSAEAKHTKDPVVRKNLLAAAGSLLLAAAAMAATFDGVSRGYSTGKECYLGNGCYTTPTVTLCIDCCDKHCGGGLFSGCVDMCIGRNPGAAVVAVKDAALRIQSGSATGSELIECVSLIESAQRSSDDRVRAVACAIEGETPFVQQIQ